MYIVYTSNLNGVSQVRVSSIQQMSQFDIANELARITLLSAIEFQKELSFLLEFPSIIRFLGNLLSSDLTDYQKKLSAVGVNQVIKHRLSLAHQDYLVIWNEYLQFVFDSPQIQKIEWQHLIITGKSLQRFMQEFQSQFCNIINPLFKDLHFKSKSLIYDSFLYIQSTQSTKYIFIRQTIEDYLMNALNFICISHDQHTINKDRRRLEIAVIENLSQLFNSFKMYSEGNIVEMMIKISQNGDLFSIIVQELLFDQSKASFRSLMKDQFAPERMNELKLSSKNEEISLLKAKTFKIYNSLLSQYDIKSGIEQFDQYKYLYFMQNLTPIVIENLITLAKQYEQHKIIIQEMLFFINKICKFNFMLQIFQSSFQKIFYRICVPFLQTTQEQRECFESNYSDFIKTSQQLIEYVEQKSNTVKNAAGLLIESLCHIIHGSLLFIVENSIQTIRFLLLSEAFPQISQAISIHNYRPSIDTSLIILSIFSSHYQKRPDLYQIIKNKLLSIQELLINSPLEKARLLIFLAYNYQNLYEKNPQQGREFLIYADKGLQQSNCVSPCSLLLFQNCLKLGFGDDIWTNLINRIQTSKVTAVFILLNKIVKEMLQNLPIEKVIELIMRIIKRLICEYSKAAEECKEGKIKGSNYLYHCLDIIESITNNEKYLKEEGAVIQHIWPIFDLFQFVQNIEFEDNILAIFNKILNVQKTITHKHFQFLPSFIKIYQKQGGFMDLLQTLTLLLTKGRDYLLTTEQGECDLQNVLQFLKQTYGQIKNQQTLKHILIFYHYISLDYHSIIKYDQQFYVKLMENYQMQRQFLKSQTKAAIINFLLVWEYRFGGCDLSIIKENSIEIFRGYQANLFSYGLRNIIEKSCHSDEVLDYLRYSIRLLHFVRKIKEQPQRNKYYSPNFPELQSIDPFDQICQSLNYIKRNLPPQRYDSILQELNNQISLGEIKDLLSKRIIENNIRTIQRVKHFY